MRRLVRIAIECVVELALLPLLALLALGGRLRDRAVDVGIGPEPIVTHRHLARAFALAGFSAQTFATHTYFITADFDVNLDGDLRHPALAWVRAVLNAARMFAIAVARYRCLYIRFHGGPLMETRLLRRLEPFLLRIAGVKVVVCGYGSDVQHPRFVRNLRYKHALVTDYPKHHRTQRRIADQLERWTRHADVVISGCDWVDYTPHWDLLLLADWCLDVPRLPEATPVDAGRPLRVLHAPNHTTIKGTAPLTAAIERLRAEGLPVELVLRQKLPNSELLALLDTVDVVADQFVIGWYGFFAVEAMSRGKPVMAFLEPRYLELFRFAGVIAADDDVPVLRTAVDEIEAQLRWALTHRDELAALGRRGHAFVTQHHSLQARAKDLAQVMARLGISPTLPPAS